MKVIKLISAAIIGLSVSTAAQALEIVQTGSKAAVTTDWADAFVVDKFDGTLGVLQRVTLEVNGAATTTAGYENLSLESPNDITIDYGADVSGSITLSISFGTIAAATASQTFLNVPVYDLVTDFGGTSGDTLAALATSGSSVDDTNFYAAAIRALLLADFTDADGLAGGLDTFILDFAGNGASSATDSAGNVASSFSTIAGGDWTLTYFYNDGSVPVPAPLLLMGFGLVALAGARRLKK